MTRYRWDVHDALVRERVERLRTRLGGRCSTCGMKAGLHFHHLNGKAWRSREIGPMQRIGRYEVEAGLGLLVLMCKRCHESEAAHPDYCFCSWCRGDEF